MELSKAPRLTPFTAWGGSCVGASVLAGGKGAAGGGGAGGGGGGNADIPVEERAQSVSPHTQYPCYCSVLGRKDFGETASVFPQTGQHTLYCVMFLKYLKRRSIKGELIKSGHFSQVTVM